MMPDAPKWGTADAPSPDTMITMAVRLSDGQRTLLAGVGVNTGRLEADPIATLTELLQKLVGLLADEGFIESDRFVVHVEG